MGYVDSGECRDLFRVETRSMAPSKLFYHMLVMLNIGLSTAYYQFTSVFKADDEGPGSNAATLDTSFEKQNMVAFVRFNTSMASQKVSDPRLSNTNVT
eukprot:9483784-Pyramimonas_sp.AAC.1